MDVARLVLDFIDSLKWAALVAVVLAWLLYRYKKEIGAAIASLSNRPVKMKTPLGDVELGPQPDVTPPDKPAPQAPPVSDEMLNELLQEHEQALANVETVAKTNAQLTAEITELRTAYEGLAREYLAARQALYYEQVYRFIFGSQIELLQWLRIWYPNTQPIGTLNVYHQKYVGLATAVPYVLSFNEYLRFLFTSQLIELIALDVRLTENGAGFCDYLVANNLSVLRPL